MSPGRQHLEAFLLALASSTDNFAVGVGLGVKSGASSSLQHCNPLTGHKKRRRQVPLFWWTNLVIAVCNAGGAHLATSLGSRIVHLDSLLEWLAPLLSSVAFSYLACTEAMECQTRRQRTSKTSKNDDDDEKDCKNQSSSSTSVLFALALPMTLNNLAGGFVGGVAGIGAGVALFHALVASLLTMACGYYTAAGWYRRVRPTMSRSSSDSDDSSSSTIMMVTAGLYAMLSLLTLHEAYSRFLSI